MSASRAVLLAAALGVALVGVLHAQSWQAIRLAGEVAIAGRTLVDAPPEESKNSHAYVTVTGPAAMQMYRNMRANAQKDDCREGNTIKQAGALSCSLARNGKAATCDFAIDLTKGVLDGGRPC